MIRKVCLLFVCMSAVVAVSAQTVRDEAELLSHSEETTLVEEKVEYETDPHKVILNPFKYNWFISAGAGAQVYFGDHDRQATLGKRLAPVLDIAVGKWFSPSVGIRFVYSGLSIKGLTQHVISEPAHSTGDEYLDRGGWPEYLYRQQFGMFNIHGDITVNLSNLIFGYKLDRVWNLVPYVGIGWAHVYESPVTNHVSGNAGIMNSFRISDALDVNLDIRGMWVNDHFDGEEGGRPNEGMLSASLGLTYKFKPRDWSYNKTVHRYNKSEVDNVLQKLADMDAENERLRNDIADNEGRTEEITTIAKKIAAENIVIFPINKTELTDSAKKNLDNFAAIIKSLDAETVYVITGYADEGTGNPALNDWLSKERAGTVYNYLVDVHGINPEQLKTAYKGGVENMYYDDPRLSRSVIITIE